MFHYWYRVRVTQKWVWTKNKPKKHVLRTLLWNGVKYNGSYATKDTRSYARTLADWRQPQCIISCRCGVGRGGGEDPSSTIDLSKCLLMMCVFCFPLLSLCLDVCYVKTIRINKLIGSKPLIQYLLWTDIKSELVANAVIKITLERTTYGVRDDQLISGARYVIKLLALVTCNIQFYRFWKVQVISLVLSLWYRP